MTGHANGVVTVNLADGHRLAFASATLDVDVPMPWRIVIKWRVSTMAGF